MYINIIFIAIIAAYAVLGYKKGGVWAIGSVIALILSIIIARAIAIPVTERLFRYFGFQALIERVISSIGHTGMNEISTTVVPNVSVINEYISKVSGSVGNMITVNSFYIGSRFVIMIIFSILMFGLGMVIKLLNNMIKEVPFGKTLNGVVGLVCGIIKGVIVVIIIYFMISCINLIPGVNIPVDLSVLDTVMSGLRGLVNTAVSR